MNEISAFKEASIPDPAAVAELKAMLRGRLLQPGDEDYDATRVVWNAMIDRRPAFIAQCRGTADVIAAVNFARTHGLIVAVRGGGHNDGMDGPAFSGRRMIARSPYGDQPGGRTR